MLVKADFKNTIYPEILNKSGLLASIYIEVRKNAFALRLFASKMSMLAVLRIIFTGLTVHKKEQNWLESSNPLVNSRHKCEFLCMKKIQQI